MKERLLNPLAPQKHFFDIRKAENNGLVKDINVQFPMNKTITNDTTTVQFPNQDAKIVFFCQMTGHRAQGMEGNFIVGSGASSSSSSPGFGFYAASAAILAMVAIPVVKHKFVTPDVQ